MAFATSESRLESRNTAITATATTATAPITSGFFIRNFSLRALVPPSFTWLVAKLRPQYKPQYHSVDHDPDGYRSCKKPRRHRTSQPKQKNAAHGNIED